MGTEGLDMIYTKTPISKWTGLPADELGKAYTDEAISGLIGLIYDIGFTPAGGRLMKLITGLGLATGATLAKDSFDRRTKADMHHMAGGFLNTALDPSLEEMENFLESAVDIKRNVANPNMDMATTVKKSFLRDSADIEQHMNRISDLKDELLGDIGGGSGPDITPPKAGSAVPSLNVESTAMNKATEVGTLTSDQEVGIRGGF